MDFAQFWSHFWTQNPSKSIAQFDQILSCSKIRLKKIRHLKYTLPALFTSRGVPLGKGREGVKIDK